MAVLTTPDRQAICAEWQREISTQRIECSITKADLQTAVNAIDSWVDANAASFNTAIPQPARTALSAKQKAWLLQYVVKRRFEVS